MNLPDEVMPWAGFCLALIVAILILLRRSYRYFGRRASSGPALVNTRDDKNPLLTEARDAGAMAMREEVQIEEVARAASARLDSKIRVLEYLTGTAQQKIDQLEILLDRAERLNADRSEDLSES